MYKNFDFLSSLYVVIGVYACIVIEIVIGIQKCLERHSKAKRRAPAYSRALRCQKGIV